MSCPRSAGPVLVLLVAACASAPEPPPAPPPPPPPSPPPLVAGNAEVRPLAELLRMEDRRELDGARVAQLIRHANIVVRRHAALAAGRVGDNAATPLLLEALNDEDARVRADAAFALGLLGDTSAVVIDALASLALGDAEPAEPAIEAVSALARLAAPDGPRSGTAAEPAATAALRVLLTRYAPLTADSVTRNALPMDDVGREALVSLWRLPALSQFVDLVLPHFTADDAETRWRAVYPFARQDAPPSVVPHLREVLLTDPDALTRTFAARALRADAADATGERTESVHALTAALTDPDPHVRINALGALAGHDDASVADAIAFRTEDPDGNVIMAALQALGSVGGPVAMSTLERIARFADRHMGFRAAALTGLTSLDADRAMGVAVSWATSTSWLARYHSIRALGRGDGPRERDVLHRLARDRDPRVAAAALREIPGVVEDPDTLEPLFLEALGSGDVIVRAAAARGLGRTARPAHMAALMEAYDRSRFDTLDAAALAAIDALAELEEQGMPVSRAFFLRFPRTEDPDVHRRVVQRFGISGWGSPPDEQPQRGLSFYEQVVRTLVLPSILGGREPVARIGTPYGEIVIRLAAHEAPLTVLNFIELVDREYYTPMQAEGPSGHRWHRVVPNFVLQDGDPRGDGAAGPGHTIRDEINRLRYHRGMLGMALSGPDTGGAQFFITHSPQPHLDGGYTIFGEVIDGLDAADRVIQEDPILYIRVDR